MENLFGATDAILSCNQTLKQTLQRGFIRTSQFVNLLGWAAGVTETDNRCLQFVSGISCLRRMRINFFSEFGFKVSSNQAGKCFHFARLECFESLCVYNKYLNIPHI